MDPADILLLSLAVLGGALPVGLIAAWRYHVRRIKELQRQLDDPEAPDGRIAALEHTIDSLARQVDQLASGQEFLTRLIADKDRPQVPRVDTPRVVTPH